MPRLTLKSILKTPETSSLINNLIKELDAVVSIEDLSGKIILGSNSEEYKTVQPITLDEETIGYIKGGSKSLIIADFLNHLLKKESSQKKLGSEVLNLYSEINLIFNFSEKLAHTIDATTICSITMDEASHIIRSDRGAVLLLDETTQTIQLITSDGTDIFPEQLIGKSLHDSIILSGQSNMITDTDPLIDEGLIAADIQSLIYASLKVNQRIMGCIILACNECIQYTAADIKLLTTLSLQASSAIESALLYQKSIRESKEREEAMRLVYEATHKFVPYEFIGSLGHKLLTDVRLGDQVEKIVTVLFSDIRDYTTMSEVMTPEENFRFVCSFNERMGPIIRKNRGFINQYIGDAIMAIFPGTASDALSAAIEMQNELAELNLIRKSDGEIPLEIGIGMHTGPLIMGITGDAERLDATTISDAVNTASRLESLTKDNGANIILSEAAFQHLVDKNAFKLRSLGDVQLKGKQQATKIYECLGNGSIS